MHRALLSPKAVAQPRTVARAWHLRAACMVDAPPARTVLCAEACSWLAQQPSLPCVVTSLPDITELGNEPLCIRDSASYRSWFRATVELTVAKLRPGCVAVFCQTSTNFQGELIDKSYLCQQGAADAGATLLWHKIALRSQDVSLRYGKLPGFSHLIAFASPADDVRTLAPQSRGFSIPDVFWRGDTVWSRATGVEAALHACRFVASLGATELVDPFCGSGTVLACANHVGLQALGVDLSPKRCRHAGLMELKPGPQGE